MTDSPLPVDSRDLWEATFDMPEQVEAAVDAAQQVDGLPGHDEVENVVVLGMGDSGIVGDVLTAVAAPFMPVPGLKVVSPLPGGRLKDSASTI